MQFPEMRRLIGASVIALVLAATPASLFGAKEDKEGKEDKKLQAIEMEIEEQVDLAALKYRSQHYDDGLLQGYVNELGQRLVPDETPEGVLFSFRVIWDPTPNAVALPDGRIFINSGLLTFVDNEAQLAMILGHEIGHVLERHTVEAIKAARSFKRSLITGLVATTTAKLSGSRAAGDQAGQMAQMAQAAKYNRKQEDEADLVGARLALDEGFDPSEAVGFFEKLSEEFGEQGRLSNMLFGSHSLNKDRAESIRAALESQYSDEFTQKRVNGELTVGDGQLLFHASAMIRDTAIQLADEYDRYDLAKERLEAIQDVRASDPKTLWYLGRIYKTVARSEEDKAKALDLLQRAAELDVRSMYPEIHKDLGLFLMSRSGNVTGAVESLKKYVVGYGAKYHRHPQDLEQMYDFLLLFGDGSWTAPEPPREMLSVTDVSSLREAVAQATAAAEEYKSLSASVANE